MQVRITGSITSSADGLCLFLSWNCHFQRIASLQFPLNQQVSFHQIRCYRRGFALGNTSQAFFFEKQQLLHSTLQSRFLALLRVMQNHHTLRPTQVRTPSNLFYIFMIFLLSERILYHPLLGFIEIK